MRTLLTYSLALAFIFGMAGCQDLSVENQNNPDRTLALAEPGDVENLIAETFTSYWSATQWCEAMLWTTMADENSSAWANWGMRDMSSEPRVAWNNAPTYSRAESTERPWFRSYTGISNANDGLQAIARAEAEGSVDNNTFTREGIDTNRLKAFARFNQGLLYGWLALYFDQAFIVDETVDLNTDVVELAPYTDVMDAAIAFFDQSIAIAQSNPFTITSAEDWIFGLDITNEDLVRLANSYVARHLAQEARSAEERAAVDWNEVLRRLDAGITEDFAPIGDDNGDVNEWDCMKFFGQNGTTWSRADYRTIGPADESGGYDAWLNTPLADRLVFNIETSDRRIVGSADDPTVDGTDFQYQGTNGPFPPARGTYHYSSHNHKRFQFYNAANANGPMVAFAKAEVDLLRAEALLRTQGAGAAAEVAELINRTRVERGQLNPATANDAVGAPSDAQSHLDSASLWAKLKHEKRIETFQTAAALAFYDDRGWGDLVTGTPIHFPVPGKELETLGLPNYTFGGVGGPGAAPKVMEQLEISHDQKNARLK